MYGSLKSGYHNKELLKKKQTFSDIRGVELNNRLSSTYLISGKSCQNYPKPGILSLLLWYVTIMISHLALPNMIKQQLRTNGVLNERVLDLFTEIPRHLFVPEAYQSIAYSDLQIPLAQGQRMLTPTHEGLLLQTLNLQGHETVLEVGTGSGYFTALLSRMASRVISIDCFPEFTHAAQKKLPREPYNNIELHSGDACNGWFDKAPYDVVILTGAVDNITDSLRLQVLPGGKLIAMLGHSPVVRTFLFTLDHKGDWDERFLFETDIPSLIDPLKSQEFVF